MIRPEWMAVALLAVSWVTALMVAIDALIDVRAWLARLRQWRTHLVTGTARSTLGSLAVEQRARTFDDGGIGFFERGHVSTVAPGDVDVAGEVLSVVPAPEVEVWLPHGDLLARAACGSPAEFSRLLVEAKGKGCLRTVTVEVSGGSRVWIAGVREGQKLVASLVSTTEPRAEARWRLALNAGLVLLDLAWVGAGTALALWPPAFGAISIIGASVLLGHLLGITPLAIKVRELSKTPARRELLGEWRPLAAPPTVAASGQ
ncbi:MAG: hypothetical protein JNJ54_12990 [Myxococcaceae bacterium]|nr:hypothetical protein [Myxococcaceae bacterium]